MQKRRIIATSALPYANGDIHLGHLVEYLQTDFWTRFQKMRGHDCVYICADDTHGTPVMIRAQKEGRTPRQVIQSAHEAHSRDFAAFEVGFDNYYSTDSAENKELCNGIFAAMEKSGALTERTVPQLYCEHCGMFLPDRYVKGTCPKCGAPGQYGDNCDKCGATYAAEELGTPVCTQCGGTPAVRNAGQLYFELEPSRAFLQEWLPLHTSKAISNKLSEWFGEPLRGWCISRAAPYFGFPIPGHPDKFFYVWVDAPVGYLASLKNWCAAHGQDFADWWGNPSAERYHFIGKDIIRFHCLLWPAMLKTAGFALPDKVFVHGFLTVDGEKMSKTKGTFINARTYLNHLPAWALRYYYACKLGPGPEDMDMNLDDFVQRVNSDLVGKITNLASRGAQMLNKHLGGRLGTMDAEGRALAAAARARADAIAALYEERKFSQIPVETAALADEANKYFDSKQPWKTVKDPAKAEETRAVLTAVLNAFRIIAIYLKPVLPSYAEKAAALFGESDWMWADAMRDVENAPIGKYEYLAVRIDSAQVKAMVAEATEKPADSGEVAHESRSSKNKAERRRQDASAADGRDVPAPAKPEIAFADFEKPDLRVATVLSCKEVPKSQKLLEFRLDCGPLGGRTVFSGIRQAYPDPSALVGKQVLFVANLPPRKMSVGVSEGMILFAGTPGENGGVLSPAAPVPPGTPAL